jgi:hypothetical protein
MQGPSSWTVLYIGEIVITPETPLEGIFTYSTNPGAAGTLIETASVATAGTDSYGNHYLTGHSSYSAFFATSLNAGFISFYTGSLSAGWTFVGELSTDATGDMFLETANGVLELSAAGNVSISGNLTVTGTFSASGDTGSSGLPNGTISGSSGQINTGGGTAHTHGPGSYAVTNGNHSHTL